MRGVGMRGMALLDVLAVLTVLGVLFAAAIPAVSSLYARAAVEYEAMRLVAELRRVQAISRTTAMSLYMLEGERAWERMPRLWIRSDGYDLNRPFAGDVRVHGALPLVRFYQETMNNTPVVFNQNSGIAQSWSSNMTIRVYVAGHEEDALRVVIDRGARIRLRRGAYNAADEE